MSNTDTAPRLEVALARLEQLAARLDSDAGTLEDAMKNYEEGIGLARECLEYLDETELRIERLQKSLTRPNPKSKDNRELE